MEAQELPKFYKISIFCKDRDIILWMDVVIFDSRLSEFAEK